MRDCEKCARCGRDGCQSWDCDFVPRDEAIRLYKEAKAAGVIVWEGESDGQRN